MKLRARQAVPCSDMMEVQGQAEHDSQAEKATLGEERHHQEEGHTVKGELFDGVGETEEPPVKDTMEKEDTGEVDKDTVAVRQKETSITAVTGNNPPRPTPVHPNTLVTNWPLEHALTRPVTTPCIVPEGEKKKKETLLQRSEEKLSEKESIRTEF